MASLTGQRIVEMVWEDLKPSDILTAKSFDNAITTVLAMSGSTNAIVHLIAMARRAGMPLDLGALRRTRAHHAGAREPAPGRQVPDGRLLLRRRLARAARWNSAT